MDYSEKLLGSWERVVVLLAVEEVEWDWGCRVFREVERRGGWRHVDLGVGRPGVGEPMELQRREGRGDGKVFSFGAFC